LSEVTVLDGAATERLVEDKTMQGDTDKIVIYGAAGLVGQNLAIHLREQRFTNLVGIDKHAVNVEILRGLNPQMRIVNADLAQPGEWQDATTGTKVAVLLHAQIGGEAYGPFVANNIRSTELILENCRRHGVEYIVHISSSVVNSQACDYYTETKKNQERLVRESGIPHCVLRPTLMFGWFDRKHLGWLSRFMRRAPVFPIPGSGRYMRQPLYVLDFCRIVARCIERRPQGEVYNITGRERVDYIDIIREIKRVTAAKARIVRIPYGLFWVLLKAYAAIDRDPPFTTAQLKALATPDEFELIPWWEVFDVRATPLGEALTETFQNPRYSSISLQF
jgi:nucleoside-diphosphate-sugar epimerase